jgi:lysozyme
MKVSPAGLDLIRHFEGLFLKAYLCPAKVWTIGYGHTGLTHKDGTVKAGRVITEKEAVQLLAHDMGKFEDRVNRLVTVDLTQDEFDALVSFDFNTGALHKSTLLRKLNQGDKRGAAAEFSKWTRGGGRVLPGLVRRRKSERHLFESGQLAFFQ